LLQRLGVIGISAILIYSLYRKISLFGFGSGELSCAFALGYLGFFSCFVSFVMMECYLYSYMALFKKWQRNLWHINNYHGNAQLIFALPSQNYKWKRHMIKDPKYKLLWLHMIKSLVAPPTIHAAWHPHQRFFFSVESSECLLLFSFTLYFLTVYLPQKF
jgi:hypothetical protein